MSQTTYDSAAIRPAFVPAAIPVRELAPWIAFGGKMCQGVGESDLVRSGRQRADVHGDLRRGGGALSSGNSTKAFELICDGRFAGLGVKAGSSSEECCGEEERAGRVLHACWNLR